MGATGAGTPEITRCPGAPGIGATVTPSAGGGAGCAGTAWVDAAGGGGGSCDVLARVESEGGWAEAARKTTGTANATITTAADLLKRMVTAPLHPRIFSNLFSACPAFAME